MTGLEKITHQILADAQKDADRILAEAAAQAEAESARILEEGRQQADEIAAKAEEAQAFAHSRSDSAAQLQYRRAILAAKQQLIGQALAQARAQLESLPDAPYFSLLYRMLARFAEPGAGEIRFSARDLARLPADFGAQAAAALAEKGGSLTVSDQPIDAAGGFVLVYGGIEVDCTFAQLFYAAREPLQDKMQQLLFG